jgi:ABC-type proline/glycine betaine transport system permease subunit
MNNSSLFTADRVTHLKIVVVALLFAILVAGVGVAARITDAALAVGRYEATVVKADKPITASTGDTTTIR